MIKKLNFGNILFLSGALIFIVHHFYLSPLHFHDCDSSILFNWIKYSSFDEIEVHLKKTTPDLILNFRLWVAELTRNISFKPLLKFFEIPFKSTYPPLIGFIFGFIDTITFKKFYEVGSFINGLALLSSSIFLYLTCLKLNYSRYVSLFSSLLILNLYSTNSYSFHLGSTVWFIFSISLGIFLSTLKQNLRRKVISSLLIFISYPYFIWLISEVLLESLSLSYLYLKKRISLNKIYLKFFKNYGLISISLIINLILFYPFNSGYRYGPDLRGLYTMFSFSPLNNSNHFVSIIISFLIYTACTIAILKTFYFLRKTKYNILLNFSDNGEFSNKSNFSNKNKINILCIFFIILFIFFVLNLKLSFSTTRHSLFILPPLILLFSSGINEVINSTQIKKEIIRKIIPYILIFFIPIMFGNSIYYSMKRVDVLKQVNLPDNIVRFVNNAQDLEYIIINCSPHLEYANFKQNKINYDLNKSNLRNELGQFYKNDLYSPGEKLLVSQIPINSKDKELIEYLYKNSPKKGDEINITSKKVKLKVESMPYIFRSGIYFDSLNQKSKIFNLNHSLIKLSILLTEKFNPSNIDSINAKYQPFINWYNLHSELSGEEFPYARPNDIWIIPLKVDKF